MATEYHLRARNKPGRFLIDLNRGPNFALHKGARRRVSVMLSEPISVTYDTVAFSLPRVGNTSNSATYRDSTRTFEIRTGNTLTKGRRRRSAISLTHNIVSADPFVPATNSEFSRTLSLVINEPEVGFTAAQRVLFLDTFLDYLRTGTDAAPIAVFGGQI